MKRCNKVLKAGLGYTIGNLLIKGINFLSIPVFARLMTTDEFGIYNVFISYETILFTIIGLAIHTSIRSANIEFRDKIDDYTSSVSLLYVLNMMFLLIVSIIFNSYLQNLLGFPRVYIVLLVVYAFSSAVIYLYNNKIALEYDYSNYLILSFASTIGNVFLSLLLIQCIFREHKDFGRILGATITVTTIAVIILLKIYRRKKPRYNKAYWKFAIQYSVPIVPHSISQIILAQFDRVMIKTMVGNSEAGIYSMAANIKLILTIIMESISTAWSTWFYEKMQESKEDEISLKAKQLVVLFLILSIGLLTLSPELIWILGGKEYAGAEMIAIPMILDALLVFMYNVIVQAEYYLKKTTYIMYGTVVIAVINIITNYIFIKEFGFIAAAYTTLFSYLCYLIMHIIISRKVIGFFIVPVKDILWIGGIACICAWLDIIFINNLLMRIVVLIIVLLFILVIYRRNVYYLMKKCY